MSRVDVSALRSNLAEILDATSIDDVLIEQDGKLAGVLISPERHAKLLESVEELEDVRAFDESMAKDGDNVPWEQVRKMLRRPR